MKTIHRDIVSVLILASDSKLLMGRKDPQSGGVYADCWHIPGGGIEEGESHKAALRREVLEETGIDIAGGEIVLADDKGRDQAERTLKNTGEKVLCDMHFYVYRVDLPQKAAGIKTKPGDDLVKLAWIDKKNLTKYKLTPPSVELCKRLGLW